MLHIIERLRRGGPAHALIGAAKYSRLAGFRHRLISLLPADPLAKGLAAAADIAVVSAPDATTLRREIAEADIVQLHFWNSAAIHELLESDLPDMRILVWCHVNGAGPPHILPKSLLAFGGVVAATTASTLDLPAFRAADPARIALVPGGADFSRLEGLLPRAHSGFNVGYIGRVDFVKLHADFIRMSTAVEVPGVRFLVCGDGGARRALERQAEDVNESDRFVFSGYVEDIRPILSQIDVFGYPLCADNSTSTELVLQEVMYAGIPPVVLPHGGAAQLVVDGYSGVVAANEVDYTRSIERLYRDPTERRRLGVNAARQARETFGVELTAGRLDSIYSQLLRQPKGQTRNALASGASTNHASSPTSSGAWALVRSLDGVGDADFITSLETANEADAEAAERRIPLASANMTDIVLQYRLHYPDDAYLRLWVGLIFAHRHRAALAASEFKASLARGCVHPRVHRYFAASVRAAGAPTLAEGIVS